MLIWLKETEAVHGRVVQGGVAHVGWAVGILRHGDARVKELVFGVNHGAICNISEVAVSLLTIFNAHRELVSTTQRRRWNRMIVNKWPGRSQCWISKARNWSLDVSTSNIDASI